MLAQTWYGYGANPQHTAQFTGVSQPVGKVHWQASLDDDRNYYGGVVFIHYASPAITAQNTVVHGYRVTTYPGGNPDYDNWSVIGRNGSTGQSVWQFNTDYSAPAVYPADWTTVYPMSLVQNGSFTGVAMAGAGGTVFVKSSADIAGSAVSRMVFYTTLANYNANPASYAPIKINTPITADSAGNLYFGYDVTGPLSGTLSGLLGSGGIVKVNPTTGAAVYRSASSMGSGLGLTRAAMNASPVVSTDGKFIYAAMVGNQGMLVKLSTANLSLSAHVALYDPSIKGAQAYLIDESSGSPMVGTDGHVFMGVFGNQWRESHGWMLQFDANLSQTNSAGKQYPIGAFGWDDTPSVVPANIVPSYKGKSSYLILTKYNNYDDNGSDPGADGSNKVALLDPSSNSVTRDRQSGLPVMTEALTVLSPNLTNDDPSHPNARYEWCINSAAVDLQKRGAIINCEDGHLYRWDFTSNAITEALNLEPATSEAYTSTSIGPDGQLYAINNAVLFAVGFQAEASAITPLIYAPNSVRGNLQSIWFTDGNYYSVQSTFDSDLGTQAAAVEADFNLGVSNITQLSAFVHASGALGSTVFIEAWDYSKGGFTTIGSSPMQTTQTAINALNTNASHLISSSGEVRLLIQAVLPSHVSRSSFSLSIDDINCAAH